MPFYVFFINIEKRINDSSSRAQTITISFTSPFVFLINQIMYYQKLNLNSTKKMFVHVLINSK